MNRRLAALLGMLLACLLVLSACGTDSEDGGTEAAPEEGGGTDAQAQPAQSGAGDLTIAVVTHGDGGSFWSVAKRGAEQAATDLGVTLSYQESNNDPQAQAQLIDTAVSQGVDGIAVSVPNPDALRGSLQSAVDAGIPLVTLNSGADEYDELGAITHVGQTETIAGEGAGTRLAEEGGTAMLCIIHEQANTALQERCDGAAATFGGEVEHFQVSGTGDVSTTLNEIQVKLESDTAIDSVLALNPDIAIAARDAIAAAGSDATLATFDLSGEVVSAIESGEISFAIDQQQYLQGYLPVVFLTLHNTNANTVGGGQPVLTGPGFVDASNAGTVADLADQGTR